ncbi:MAG: hypothetical protein ACYTGZ_05495 [Planctomycetota bacterium]|jgi:hypothetical protein
MLRAAVFLALIATPATAAPETRLGALLGAYLRENQSVSRREELLEEIRRVTDDDVTKVADAIRRGEHQRYAARPVLRADGEPPVFKGRSYRCDRCAETIARSAGRYASLVLPPDYDPGRRYPLLMDIGANARPPTPDAVTLVVNPQLHPQAAKEAVALERLVIGLVAHACELVSVDPDRVFLRGDRAYSELVWYIGFQNPDRFAGLYCGPNFWGYAALQAPHVRHFGVLTTHKRGGDPGMEAARREFLRYSRDFRMGEHPTKGSPGVAKLKAVRDAWQQATKRLRSVRRLELVCLRPYPMRCQWLRLVPKTRSRRESTIAKKWSHRLLPQPGHRSARIKARFDDKERNLLHVTTENLVAFQIYVDPRLFDIDRAVRVKINGATPVARLIDPDIGELLDDYRERRDSQLLYVDRLSFP